jgi:endonuclease/exonuclease/phosphatase family metal-dependent hydrolase
MKRLFFPLLTLLLAVLLGIMASRTTSTPVSRGDILDDNQRTTTPSSIDFRIGTYNIHSGKGHDESTTPEAIAGVLNNPPLDIIGLQEVTGHLVGDGNQASELADILALGWLYAPTRNKPFSADFGSALLSRFPIQSYEIRPLLWERRTASQTLVSRAHRNLISVTLDFQGNPVKVFITHIDRGPLRLEQLQDVINEFKQYPHAILMGDLNSKHNDAPLRAVLDSGEATDAIAVTAVGEDIDKRIDWILTRGFTVVAGGSHPRGVSDHPQYWVELQLDTTAADSNGLVVQ